MGVLKFVDTFAGIGGFRLAAEGAIRHAGATPRCVMSVEKDTFAKATYKDNFGDEPSGDIREIRPEAYPDHDLLLGGFPCQAFSRNGKYYNHNKRTLGEDDRNNLFLCLVDILKAKQPSVFVFENVKEIQSIKNKDGSLFIDTVLENLRGCGYVVSTKLVDSADHGVPQQRKRVYFTGVREDIADASELRLEQSDNSRPNLCVKDILDKSVAPKYLLETNWRNRWLNGGMKGNERNGIPGVLKRLADKGIPKEKYAAALEEWLKASGPQISRLSALRLAYECGEWNKPTAPTSEITPVAIIYGDTPSGLPRQQDKLYSVMGISPTIATFSTPAFDVEDGWRLLTPEECGRLQAFPKDFKRHPRDAIAYKQFGNAVTVTAAKSQVLAAVERL